MADITYRFVASGYGDVEKAFAGIERAAQRQKKAVEASSASVARAARATGGPGGANTRRGLSDTEKLATRVAAAQERAAQREVKAAERAAISKQRAQERAQRYTDRLRDKNFADAQRKEEKHAREALRRTEQAARKEAAAKERAQKEADSKRKQSFGVLKDIAGGAFLGAVGTGAALIGGAAREALQLQEATARIAIAARGAGEKERDVNELRRGFERTAMATPGQTAGGIADAVARFVSLTGDLDTALKSQGTFATVASASGASVGDIAEAAASLSQQFDVKGIDDMREALAALSFQGKNGAFELKDAAAQFQRLAASGAAFGIPKGVGGVKILGGLTQIARSGTGSSEQAATAVENLLTNLKVKQKMLGAAGVDVFDKGGKARDVRDVIVEAISKVGGGDMAKKSMGLAQIFGEQGIRAINPLVAKYTAAFQGTKGTDAEKTAAGIKALRDEIERSINAPGDWADVQEDAAMAQKDASAQVTASWEAIKAKTADALLPSIAKLAESLAGKESLLDPFIEAVGLAAEAVVWFAEATGFKKAKTKAEVLAEAEKKSAKAEKEALTAGPMTPETFAEVYGASDKAFKDLWGIPESGGATRPMTLDEAADAYLKANPETATPEAMAANREATKNLLATGGNDWFLRNFGGENQAQQDIRHQVAGQYGFNDVAGKPSVSTEDIQAALDAAAKAAKAAAEAMTQMAAAGQQGSIIGGPGT